MGRFSRSFEKQLHRLKRKKPRKVERMSKHYRKMLDECSHNLIEKKVNLFLIYSIKWPMSQASMTNLENITNSEVNSPLLLSSLHLLSIGFLIVSLDNSSFVTKYCTILDGIFRVHKSRLSDQMDHQFDLKTCTLSFPEERTRDIQFALLNKDNQKIFIRGNNIYSMGRLLNTLAKYVEITGSSQRVFNRSSSPSHLYSDLELPSMKHLYQSASQISDVLSRHHSERNSTPSIQHENDIYDQPKFEDQLSIPPRPRDRIKNQYR